MSTVKYQKATQVRNHANKKMYIGFIILPKPIHVLLLLAKILKTLRKICFCLLMINKCPKLLLMEPPQLESRERKASLNCSDLMSQGRNKQTQHPGKEVVVEGRDRHTAEH